MMPANSLTFIGRQDFIWGISGHHKGYAAYPEEYLEEQIQKAAGAGRRCLPPELQPRNVRRFRLSRSSFGLCDANGLRLFLILFDRKFTKDGLTPDQLYDKTRAVSERYKGRIPLYQISNEQDLACLDLVNFEGPDGDRPEHFVREDYLLAREAMRAIMKGVRDGDPEAKTVVNFSWKHCGILEMLSADGLEWDINAIDWYSDMDKAARCQHDFRPAVCPSPAGSHCGGSRINGAAIIGKTSAPRPTTCWTAMSRFYHHPNPKVKGYMIYELLDEPALEKGEAHFGLFLNDKDGHIGRPKTAYGEIARVLNKNGAR